MDYLGYEVLTTEPNRLTDTGEDWERSATVLDNVTGYFEAWTRSDAPLIGRSFSWLLHGRTEIAEFRGWLARRAGRFSPLWVPTYQSNLKLAQPVAPADTQIVVHYAGYGTRMFPLPARRYLALINAPGSLVPAKVLSVGQEIPGREVLTLSAAAGVALSTNTSLVSFLCFSRLEEDVVEMTWHTHWLATATARFRELPMEAPA